MSTGELVILGLGTNLGDRFKNLTNCLDYLSKQISFVAVSSVYETEALLPEDAPEMWDMPYLNAVAAGYSSLPAGDLLKFCQGIEEKLGRRRDVERWSPRLIDIDILAYGKRCINTEELTIPHNSIINRAFVIIPLEEILSDWVHPIYNKSAKELLDALPAREIAKVEKTFIELEI